MVRQKFLMAGMISQTCLQYRISPKTLISDLRQIQVYEGNRKIEIKSLSSLGKSASTGYIEVGETLSLSGRYRITIDGYGKKTVIPTDVFDSAEFAERFHYDGDDLGAVIHGDRTTFKVWAPTASRVVLNLFADGKHTDAYRSVDMVQGSYGVWSHTEACGHGTYYTYSVTTALSTQEAVDPYAKAVGVNGKRGMVVDLSLTNPIDFQKNTLTNPIKQYAQAIIWEVHVKDFSHKIKSSKYAGKYLAFTEKGLVNEHGESVGLDYLMKLGITHVHLLPVFDYASVDETHPEDQFNWGYDPLNYNVPEGSYTTDPIHGEVRIKEMKSMIKALHDVGIGVVMDVVYNHTYYVNSSLNKIVPYYYYRYTDGKRSKASGCGNDTASERHMFGKLMIDSAAYWVKEYHLDGLRFDLMGLHDLKTMQEVECAVHTVNPHAILYGEGWTMGNTIDGSAQADQPHISQIIPTGDAIGGIAVFNDVIRDGLKGSVFDNRSRGYINGAAYEHFGRVAFGIRGGMDTGYGWSVKDAMVINYMSAHDNHTLWDKLKLSNSESDDILRAKMNRLGAAIVMISKGTAFFQAGEEMLRTKNGDHNSYKSGDAINNIDWSVLKKGSLAYETMLYYQGLIKMRKGFSLLTDITSEISCEQHNGLGVIAISDQKGGKLLALLNPHYGDIAYDLPKEWNLIADETQAGTDIIAHEKGTVTVKSFGIRVYANDILFQK